MVAACVTETHDTMYAHNQPGLTDFELAREALSRSIPARSQEPIPVPHQGAVNWTFRADTKLGPLAVRVNRLHDADAAYAEYVRERWCSLTSLKLGLPSPDVLAVERLGARAYTIQRWVDGVHPPADAATYVKLAMYARRLAEVRTPPEGPWFAGLSGDWQGQAQYNLAQLSAQDPLLTLAVYDLDGQQRLRSAFNDLLDSRFSVGLQHGDLCSENVIADTTGKMWLIDWGCAQFDVFPSLCINQVRLSHIEAGQPTLEGLNAFLQALTAPDTPTESLMLNQWMVLNAVALVRWALARCPERVSELAERAERLVRAYLNNRLVP